MNKVFFILLLIVGFSINSAAEDIGTEIYSSEEEFLDAYLRGEIDYQTYLNLREIFEDGIDSSSFYLLEEIPNINYFINSTPEGFSFYEQEQAESFVLSPVVPSKRILTGHVRIRGYQILEENGVSKGYVTLMSEIGNNWQFNTRIAEDYDGNQIVNRRSLQYSSKKKDIKKLIIGNYTARFGLGLAVGYRGNLLKKDAVSLGESSVFPSYGGFNGIYVEGGRKQDEIKAMAHFDRDEKQSLLSAGLDFARKMGKFQIEGIVVGTMIKNRESNADFRYFQLGPFLQYRSDFVIAALEATYSNRTNSNIPAVVFETQYNAPNFNFSLSGWHYDDDYISLTGGARSGSSYETVFIDSIDFEYSDKRIGQDGFLLKTSGEFGSGIKGTASLSAYGRNRSDQSIKDMMAIEIPVTDNSTFGLNFRNNRKYGPGSVLSENEIRVEYRIQLPRIYLRSYLGYRDDDNGSDYLSMFSRGSLVTQSFGKFEFWLNLNKIDYRNSNIDYFYGYIKESFDLGSTLEMAVKYSYRYSRSLSNHEQSTFLLEAKMRW